MAVSWKGDATQSVGLTATTSPAMPTHAAGDLLIAFWTGKPYNGTVTVAGWSTLSSGASGTTAAGTDTGSMEAAVWYKVAASGSETAPSFAEGATAWNVAGCGVACWQKGATETWDTPVAVYGADEDLAANFSMTMGSNPGITAGDGIQMVFGVCSDAGAPLTGGPTVTATDAVFGAVTKDRDQESMNGGDHGMMSAHCVVSSGTATAAPVCGGTVADAGSPRWEGVLIRLRAHTDASVTPTTVAAVVTIPGVVADATQSPNVTPTTVAVVTTTTAPAVVGNANAPPSTLAATSAIELPFVEFPWDWSAEATAENAAVTPTTVGAASTIPGVTVVAESGADVTPTTVAVVSTIPGVTVTAGASVTAGNLAPTTAIPTPAVTAAANVTPTTVAVVTTIPGAVYVAHSNVAVSYVKYETHDTHPDADYQVFGNNWGAQTFFSATAHTLIAVDMEVHKEGVPPNSLTVSIYATAAGEPTGAALGSGTILLADAQTDVGTVLKAQISPIVPLQANVVYAIVCSTTGGDGTHCWHWKFDNTAADYANGKKWTSATAGAAWSDQPTHDFFFIEYGPLAFPTIIPTPVLTGDANVTVGDLAITTTIDGVVVTIPGGTTEVIPTTVAFTTTIDGVTVAAGAGVTPTTIASLSTIETPFVEVPWDWSDPDTAENALVTPTTTVAAVVIDGAVVFGGTGVSVEPTTFGASAAFPGVVVTIGADVVPATVAVLTTIPTPTIVEITVYGAGNIRVAVKFPHPLVHPGNLDLHRGLIGYGFGGRPPHGNRQP